MIKLNGHQLEPTIFPDNTSQVWQIPMDHFICGSHHLVEWHFENEAEFIHLAQLVHLLKENKKVILDMPYLPYARQDKVNPHTKASNNTTFALHTFARLLNSLEIDIVKCKDAHSSVATHLIDNLVNELPVKEINEAIMATSPDIICYPDRGAHSKYTHLNDQIPVVYGSKQRDYLTGKIVEYTLYYAGLHNEVVITLENIKKLENKKVLIVDDLCDGGMTFKLLAERLCEFNVASMSLYVTHGIFSKGTQTLRESGIGRIFTKDGEITNE